MAAVSGALALAPAVAADEYTVTEKIIDRVRDSSHRASTKAAYKGPKVWVQGQSVNRDYCYCAPGAGDLYRWVSVDFSTSPAGADCASRRLHVPINNQYGYLHLVLRCNGLRPGTTVKLRIGPSIRRSFPLREGIGRGRVRLDKPPGRVEPLVYVATRTARTPCRILSRRTRMARRTVELRLTSHCHHVARGELSVGGLLAEDPR